MRDKNILFYSKGFFFFFFTYLNLKSSNNYVSYKKQPHGGAFVYEVLKTVPVFHIGTEDSIHSC